MRPPTIGRPQASDLQVSRTQNDAPADGAMDVSVIIVNYNVRDFLAQALHSVERASDGMSVEVFVIDNGSVDGSVEMVRRDFPHVTLLQNDENVGFSKANNQAIRLATGRYLLILNPDTILQEDTLRVLVAFLDAHPETGAAGCQILNPDGSFAPESRRAFPTPSVAFFRVSGLSKLFPRSPVFGRYNMTFLPRDVEVEVDALSGSCMMVRHAALHVAHATYERLDEEGRHVVDHGRMKDQGRALDVAPLPEPDGAGLFDETFFMYGEDLDWCFRIQEAGWTIRYTPDTRIIHYKGESTKKGDLRYVRLFYGAMLHFIEKHFQNRYSRAFAGVLRMGILARAALTVAAATLKRLRMPLVDFGLVYLCVVAVGLLRSLQAEATLHPVFLATVAPGYAVAAVAGIALARGYRRSRRHALQPVLWGALSGLLIVAAASFFLRDIAFSRLVVGTSFALIILVLVAHRLVVRRNVAEVRHAMLVGSRSEAERLRKMLMRHPAPPFLLEGFVDPDAQRPVSPTGAVPRLGAMNQLRDLVRLRRIDDVVFAAESLPHATTFTAMQQLKDLPVQFRMLLEGREHVIGKASVEDLALPALVEMDESPGARRTTVARRAFEISLALAATALYPLLFVIASVTRSRSLPRRMVERARLAPQVLTGKRALVGYASSDEAAIAEPIGLKHGVFGVAESLSGGRRPTAELERMYLFYARNQSAMLDCSIMLRSLKNRR